MDTTFSSPVKDKKVLVAIHRSSIIFHVLILLVLAGLATNFFTEYGLGGFNKYAIKHFTVFSIILVSAVAWKLKLMGTHTLFIIMVYINIVSSTIYLPFRIEDPQLNFEGYFSRVEMIIFVMGLLLAVFERPWHQLVVIGYNTVFIIACALLYPEMALGKYILAFILISSVAGISYFIFNKVIKLQNDLTEQHQLVSLQNEELVELTNFRKDIMKIIAHDLKTPIHQISMLTTVIRNSKSSEDRNTYLELLQQSIDKTYGMLDNLLNWSMQNDDALKSYMDVNVHELVEGIRAQYEQNLSGKNLKLVNEVATDFNLFYSKEVFQTVIRNLLTNAIKFSPPDREILIDNFEDENQFNLRVHNAAVDIDESKFSKINSGQMVTSSPGTRKESGSGKGLFICKRMLKNNNASLRLSKTSKGVMAEIRIFKSVSINRPVALS
ncbi:HAMP domain-containing sensor histidine kinase [Flagellimonas sp. DF-77]|uniref:sensor histidine kinase n=1 Tax=Flagellimonas algarum TaxID=3230298 RepID=UPI00339B3BA2